MSSPFTAQQKAKRLLGESVGMKVVLFPCPKCGHRNRLGEGNVERVKMYLLDELSPCKRCGAELPKARFDRSTIAPSFIKRALKELRFREVIRCWRCRQKLRVPTDKGKIRVTCPKCSWKFEYEPQKS